MKLTVYLAGQINANWREEFKVKVATKGLDIDFVAPQTAMMLQMLLVKNLS